MNIEEMAVFCKKKGFVFPSAEIYGRLSGFFDYGPLGVELKNNIKMHWWKTFVQNRPDVVGIDGSVLTHQKIWEASGHLSGFSDIMLECSKCKSKVRADQYLEDHMKKGTIKEKLILDGISADEIIKVVSKYKLKCPNCKSDFKEPNSFNLMFPVNVGADKGKDSTAYLRGETAQVIFTNFKQVVETSRLKLPFGIAQVGKAFRNEISPRDFLFRVREFEQMEIEFFVHPKNKDDCPFYDEIKSMPVNYFDNKKESKIKIGKLSANKWQQYWIAVQYKWFLDNGINPKNIRIRQHSKEELAHYATACFDIEYNFPFGWKEIYGNADRGNFDLSSHEKVSKKEMKLYDEESKEKILPEVVTEPSQGVGRAFLAFMFDAYNDDKERGNVVLKLHANLAPIKVAVFPLVKNKEPVVKKAEHVFDMLKEEFTCNYDVSGSVGRRYARNDEIGTLYCVTIDFDSLEDDKVTIRDRDTTKQIRVKIDELIPKIKGLIRGEKFK